MQAQDTCLQCALDNGLGKEEALEVSAPMREKVLKGQIVKCGWCGKVESIWKVEGQEVRTKPKNIPIGQKVGLQITQVGLQLVQI